MKIGHLAWPLLGIASMAMAQADYSATAPAAAPVAVQEPAPQPVLVTTRTRPLRETGPDLRHCLDLKAHTAIIRCTESRRKRAVP